MQSKEFTYEELKAIVAAKMADPNITAADILSTIFAALQEPTEGMTANGYVHCYNPDRTWRAMLAASALGEQSDG